jgi:hypothetical protein
MIMRSLIIGSTLLALLGAAVPAFASPAFAPGVYAEVNGGRASVSSRYADDSNDVALGVAAGYQFTPNLAAEVFTRGLSLNIFRGALVEAGYYPDEHYGVAVIGTVPLDGGFSLFGRAGIGRTKMEGNRTSLNSYDETDPSVGVGARYHFNRSWSLSLEASRLTKTDVTLITAGARFQF